LAAFVFSFNGANAFAQVRDYGRPGDDPATAADESLATASESITENNRYEESGKYEVEANGTTVSTYKYRKGPDGGSFYNFDIARFSSTERAPELKIRMKDATLINSVEIYPSRYYPQEALHISEDKKTLVFMVPSALPYCIININATLSDKSMAGNPMLAVINDPPETDRPDLNAENVLDFKKFASAYLAAHPITDAVGEQCREAGSVTDTSRNTGELFAWHFEAGRYVAPETKNVCFPDKRVRAKNDVSEAFEAALEAIRNSAKMDTIYFPAGVYVWSGLNIKNWRGNGADGRLNIYVDEDALLINRLQECKQSLEPAIGIWHSSNITVSGRGIFDGNACHQLTLDRKDARDTPHQGGAMVVQSEDITFNDTYLRDAKQWNWECHTVRNVTFNNIKGLSPFAHAWVDGLDLTSGRDVTVNGAFTLGNDDTFASGHYNPSDEFPRRFLEETDRAQGDEKARLETQLSNVCAAAAIYNKERLQWDTDDSENICVNNTLGWSGMANNIRLGANTRWKGERGRFESYNLKSYIFNNFNSVMRTSIDAVRVQNGSKGSLPAYEKLIFRNCSFSGNGGNNVAIPTGSTLSQFSPELVVMENCHFDSADKPFIFKNIKSLILRDIYAGGALLTEPKQPQFSFENIGSLVFSAKGKTAGAGFVHPGILHSSADIDRMRTAIERGNEPWISGFKRFKADPATRLSYRMRGPAEEIGRKPNVKNVEFDSDANAAYQLALYWAITREKAYAAKAIEIIDLWAQTLKSVSGLDAVLMAGLGPFKMINAAEILRYTDSGWTEQHTKQFDSMLREVIYPAVRDFATFANGNWDAAAIQTVMATGVFCDDSEIFERGLLYYTNGSGNGRLSHYVINESGQCQESGRDQQHTQLGLALLAASCEIAWNQGIDLYAFDDYRLLKGFEYSAKYNLGGDVPFIETLDRTGKYHHYKISEEGRGRLRAVFEMPYNHYVNRAGLQAPFTQKAAQAVRPEGPGYPGADHPGFGTLLFSREKSTGVMNTIPAKPRGIYVQRSQGQITLSWPAVIGARHYDVERAGNISGPYEPVASELTQPAFVDANAEAGGIYRVRASNENGAGPFSEPVNAGVKGD
jgi:hypothetical protein